MQPTSRTRLAIVACCLSLFFVGAVLGVWLENTTFWRKRLLAGQIERECGARVFNPHKLVTSYDDLFLRVESKGELLCALKKLVAADWLTFVSVEFSGSDWGDSDLDALRLLELVGAHFEFVHCGQFSESATRKWVDSGVSISRVE